MKKMIQTLKRLFHYIAPYKGKFIFSLVCAILYVVCNTLTPYIVGLATTRVTHNLANHEAIDFHYIGMIVLIFCVFGILCFTLQYGASALMTVTVQNAMHTLRQDIAHKLNRLPVSFFDNHTQGDLLSRVTNDVDTLSNALQQSFINIVTSAFSIICAVTMMFVLQWKMALITLLMIPFSLLAVKVMVKFSQPYFKGQQEALGRMQGFVQESMTGFSVIKLYGQEAKAKQQFADVNEVLRKNGFRAQLLSGLLMPILNIITYGAYIFVGTMGSLLCINGAMQVGQVQAFLQYVWQVNQPLSQISQLSSVIQGATAAVNRIFSILDEPDEEERVDAKGLPESFSGAVEFAHVDFAYNSDTPLIEDLNLKVKPGQLVAIVGPTGAGKTTIVNLLMRFYDVVSGEIKLDGQPVTMYSRQKMRQQFGMVLQDTWLYETSIKENIRFGRLDATDEEVVVAAKAANAHAFITALPDGYDTIIHSESQHLSQGQIQLITIARAILSNPKILILDEATSSVDTRIEALIQDAMETLMVDRTSFVIAHRLSTIRHADMILFLEHGHIVEKGTHDELLAKDGAYASLYNSQFAKEVEAAEGL